MCCVCVFFVCELRRSRWDSALSEARQFPVEVPSHVTAAVEKESKEAEAAELAEKERLDTLQVGSCLGQEGHARCFFSGCVAGRVRVHPALVGSTCCPIPPPPSPPIPPHLRFPFGLRCGSGLLQLNVHYQGVKKTVRSALVLSLGSVHGMGVFLFGGGGRGKGEGGMGARGEGMFFSPSASSMPWRVLIPCALHVTAAALPQV
jgi:hypothetical protein